MARKKTKRKLGRPPIQFSPAIVRKIGKYAFAGARDRTISQALGIDDDTFQNHFSEYCLKKRCEGKIALLLTQARMAKTNPTMAIWMGKQLLDQSDKQELSGDLKIGIIKYAARKAADKTAPQKAEG